MTPGRTTSEPSQLPHAGAGQADRLLVLLQNVTAAANEAETLQAALQRGVELVCAAIGWPVGHAHAPAGARVVPLPVWQVSDPDRFAPFIEATDSVTLGSGLPVRALETRKAVWISDVTSDPDFLRASAARQAGLRAAFAFPVLSGETVEAVMEFYSTEEAPPDYGLLQLVTYVGVELGRVAEREVAARRLRSLSERLRLILDATGDGIFGVDVEGICTFVNPAAAEMLGYAPEELLGRRGHDMLHHSYRDGRPCAAKDCPLYEALSTMGSDEVHDEVLWRKDGRPLPVSYSVRPTIEGGTVTGAVVAFSDATERKRAERALRHAVDREQEMVRSLREVDELRAGLVSSVSHELRSPLTSIAGYLELMLEEEGLTPEQRETLSVIERNARRLLALIEDLLSLSRIESGRLSLSRAAIDVAAAVEPVQVSLRPTVNEAGVRLAVRLDPDLPSVHADPERFEQVLVNLLSNAIKFTPSGGRITLTARAERGAVRFSIRDTGIGIPAEEQGKLFTPFFRSSAAKEAAIRGTGLGLSIVKAIVEQHGGSIGIASEPGKGTEVTFALPTSEGREET